MEEWETKNVEDRELFVPEDEVKDGSERGALKHLLNVGEDQVSITNYKEEVRKLLGLPETIKTPEIERNRSPSQKGKICLDQKREKFSFSCQ